MAWRHTTLQFLKFSERGPTTLVIRFSTWNFSTATERWKFLKSFLCLSSTAPPHQATTFYTILHRLQEALAVSVTLCRQIGFIKRLSRDMLLTIRWMEKSGWFSTFNRRVSDVWFIFVVFWNFFRLKPQFFQDEFFFFENDNKFFYEKFWWFFQSNL